MHATRPNLPHLRAIAISLGLLAAASLGLATRSDAATRWSVRGAGWGHGIGMSQYGAYGFAKRGKGHREILTHYYTGVAFGSAPSRTVRVLLKPNQRRVAFRGATQACGRSLVGSRTYIATRKGQRLALRSATGRALRSCEAPLRATGPAGLVVGGGRYRGALEVRPALFGGVNAINAVGLEAYVKGVVPNESPSSWPIEALKAQAVAARSYALATGVSGPGFEQYADVRSQVYRGLSSETAATNRAVEQTDGEVVTYDGKVAVTFFFSTSGGRTENIELAWPGSQARPWLKSVKDPYDDASPYHRWGPLRFTRSALESRLGGLVKGRFRDIRVIERGRSPRIVYAEVVGSKGTVRVKGGALRSRLRLRDTWAYFTKVSTEQEPPPDPEPHEDPPPDEGTGGTPEEGGLGSGGAAPQASAASAPIRASLSGRISPVPRSGWVRVERLDPGAWRTVVYARVNRRGAYRVAVPRGTYRIASGSAAGPVMRVR